MNYITRSFIKYNKLIYMLYAFLIMLLFNTYSATSYCEESLENIDEKIIKQNTTNTYASYVLIAVIGVTALCAAYAITVYCVPDLDVFSLFIDKDLQYFTDFADLTTKQKITVDKNVFDHLTESLKKHRQININLMEDKIQKEEQLKNLYQLLDYMSPTCSDLEQKQTRRNSI